MNTTLIISDVHGRKFWRDAVIGHSYDPSGPTEQGDHLLCLDCARPFLLEPDDTEIGSFWFKWA